MSNKKPWWNPLEPFAAPTPAEQTASQLLHDKLGVKCAPSCEAIPKSQNNVLLGKYEGAPIVATEFNEVIYVGCGNNLIAFDKKVIQELEKFLVIRGWRCS